MTTKPFLSAFIVILAVFLGCEDSTSSLSEAEADSQPLLTEFSANVLTPAAFTGEKVSEEERKFIVEHSIDDQMKMTELIRTAPSWDAAHKGMQQLLSESSQLPDYIRRQRAAVFMLKAARSLGDLNDAQREAIAAYTTMLAEYRSPEAALMIESLKRLEGYWSEGEIQYAASRSLEGADTFLNNRYYCDSCPAGKVAADSQNEIQETQDVFIKELLGSVEALRLMAGS